MWQRELCVGTRVSAHAVRLRVFALWCTALVCFSRAILLRRCVCLVAANTRCQPSGACSLLRCVAPARVFVRALVADTGSGGGCSGRRWPRRVVAHISHVHGARVCARACLSVCVGKWVRSFAGSLCACCVPPFRIMMCVCIDAQARVCHCAAPPPHTQR